MDEQKVYKFHFMMDSDMREKLENTSLYKKSGNISRFTGKVFMLLSHGIEEKHIKNQQMASRYELVHDNPAVERKGVFVYLPHHRYRQIKLMHQDLNFYSMAQLVRLFLGMFLDFVDVYGDETESKLMSLYLQWKAEKKKQRHEWWPIEELLHFCFQKSKISRFLTLYSWKFQPIGFFRL